MRIVLIRTLQQGLCPLRLITDCAASGAADVSIAPPGSLPIQADMILIDWPSAEDALDLIARLRQVQPLVPVLLVARSPDPALYRRALELHVDAVVSAPVEDAEFHAAFQRLQARCQALEALALPTAQLEESQWELFSLRREQLVVRLLTGRLRGIPNDRVIREYDLDPIGPYYFAVAISVDAPDGAARPPQIDQKTLEAFCQGQSVQIICCNSSVVTTCILNYHELEPAAFCHALLEHLHRQAAGLVSIGCGSAVEEIADLAVSLDQARSCLRCRIFSGCGQLYTVDALTTTPQLLQYFPFEQVIRMYSSASIGDQEGISQQLARVFEAMNAAMPDSNLLYCTLDLVANIVLEAISRSRHSRSRAYTFLLDFWAVLDRCCNMQMLEKELTQWLLQKLQPQSPRLSMAVADCLAYINADISAPLSLQNAAARVGLSASYLSTLFREQIGWGFSEYVQSIRLTTAATLLRDTTLSVAEISLAVGFKDYRYFTRVFTRSMGLNPTQYRRQMHR